MRAIVLASTALVLSMPAYAYDPVKDTRAILAATVTTKSIQTEYLTGKRDGTTLFKRVQAAYTAIRTAEAAVTPAPTPASGYVPALSLAGGAPLNATFPVEQGLQKSWGTGAIPLFYGRAPGQPDNWQPDEGAFRFTCGGDGPLKSDDPLLYPNQPGKSHLHKFWGTMAIDANSTPASLAQQTNSNCNTGTKTLNRSGYWMPALIDDQAMVRNPDLVSVYYKRPRSISKFCLEGSPVRMAAKGCAGLPNSIRFIFGWDPTKPDLPAQGMSWYCTAGTGKHVTNLDDLFGNEGCVAGATMVADLMAGNCWNGTNLDTPDHRAHVVLGGYGDWGFYRCPVSHPYLIPQTQNKVMWTVTADMIGTRADGSKFSRVKLSSDHMKAGAKPGETMHADYMEQWVAAAKQMWIDNCIEKGLDCTGGDLGNGLQLIGAQQPTYGWTIPADKARVAIPGS
jgi:hypothetical protein